MAILDDKVAVVNTPGQGMGREIARLMAQEGARVLINDADAGNDKKGKEPATERHAGREPEDCPGRIEILTENVEMWSGGERLIEAAIDRFGRIDILVNAAGLLPDKSFHKTNREDWDEVLDRQLKGAFIGTRLAGDQMRKQKWGRIIYIISARAFMGSPGQAGAATADQAVTGLARNAAIELEYFNVTANCIAASDQNQQDSTGAAPLAVFLAGESARGISGQIFGTRGAEVYLYSQPRPARSLHCSEGWTPESLAAMLEPAMKNEFESLDQAGEYFSWEPMG